MVLARVLALAPGWKAMAVSSRFRWYSWRSSYRFLVRLWLRLWGFGDMVGLDWTLLSHILILLIYGSIAWHIILPIKIGNAAMVLLLRREQVVLGRGLFYCV